jgi:anaphase-promoting complex subunit 10
MSVVRTLPRRPLGVLDLGKDMNVPRAPQKRDPIAFKKENADAIMEGIRLGTYDLDEIIALTNFRLRLPATGPNDSITQGEGLRRLDHPSYSRADESDEELMEAVDDDELLGDPMTEDVGDVEEGEDDYLGSEDEDEEQLFNPAAMGLKEINNLAHFSVSSYRPGNGVAELLSDDLDKYWQ